MDVALEHLNVVHRMGQHHDPALREHDIVVQLLRQAFPQLDRMVVKTRALIKQIVGPDDGGVAARIAAAQPALFQHGNIAHAMLLGQIVGGAEAVTPTANNDRIIGRFGLRRAPLGLPPGLAIEALLEELEG